MKNLLFVLFVITMAVVKGQSSKTLSDKNAIKREVSSFNVIEVQGPFTVYFSSGKSFALAISASNESVRDRINTSITNDKLNISFGDHGKRSWQQNENMKIYVSAPTLNKIIASGAVDFIIFDELKSNELGIILSGASDFNGKINAETLNIISSGGSDLNIEGITMNAIIKVSGASDVKGFSLHADNVKAISSGASNIQITALKSINAVASGASDIEIKGNPASITKISSGASSIIQKN